jgi:hypothetical protein
LSRPCRYSQSLSIRMADPEEEGTLGSIMPVVCRSTSLEGLGSKVGYMNSEHLVFASSSQETRPACSTASFRLELASPTVLHARTHRFFGVLFVSLANLWNSDSGHALHSSSRNMQDAT